MGNTFKFPYHHYLFVFNGQVYLNRVPLFSRPVIMVFFTFIILHLVSAHRVFVHSAQAVKEISGAIKQAMEGSDHFRDSYVEIFCYKDCNEGLVSSYGI